jgi:predicted ribosomally synthesized peptide with SipW-like signal peptide
MIMRVTAQLKAAALIGLAVVVGLLGVGGTWALWNAAVPSGAGTIQAADFDIRLNNAPMGATATAAPESPGALLTPDAPVYATVKIENATNAGTPMTVAAVMNPPQVVNASHAGLTASLIVRAAEAPTSGACADAKYTQSNTSATTTIDQTKTGRLCLRMSLAAAVPPELGKTPATATITTTVTVTQQPRGQ